MKNIRKNVFETNSSSSHSITFYGGGLNPSSLFVEDDGYIYIELEEFCSYRDYYDQESRLSFIILQLIYELELDFWCISKDEWNTTIEKLYENEKFKALSDEIAEYVGDCSGIRISNYSEGYIDHEGVYGSLENFYDAWRTNLIEFVFGDVTLHFEFNG